MFGLISRAIAFFSKPRKNEVRETQEKKVNPVVRKSKKQKIFNKTNGFCAYCKVKLTIENMIATCVIPLSRGGSDGVRNKLPACSDCNKTKGNLTHEEFLGNTKGLTKSKRHIVNEKTNGHCAYCGTALGRYKKMTIDHVVPISLEGGNDIDNLLPACSTCNQAKGALTVEQFRSAANKAAKEVHNNLMNSNSKYKNAVHMGAVKIQNVEFFFERNKETNQVLPETKEEPIAAPALQEDLVIFLSGNKSLPTWRGSVV